MRRLTSSLTFVLLLLWTTPVAATGLPGFDRPATQTDQGARDLAIVVAVENYHGLAGVPGAALTAMDWEVFFKEHLGIPEDRFLKLLDQQVTPSRVQRELGEHLQKAHPEGRVWFVFVGHGAPYVGGSEIDGLLVGVSATNEVYEDFVEASLRVSEVERTLAAGAQDQTVMILDACFSGRTETDENLTGTQVLLPSSLVPRLGDRDVVFSAARNDEVTHALPGATPRRPAFSYLMLGALRGWADRDGTGQITVAEVEAFVRRGLLGMQTPSLYVADPSQRQAVLVAHAPEADPGITRILDELREGPAPADTRQAEPVEAPSAPAGPLPPAKCVTAARCLQIADDVRQGYDGPVDLPRAAAHYRRACDRASTPDELRGCVEFGGMVHRGEGIAVDHEKARDFYRKGCTDEYAAGCAGLGVLHHRGQAVERDVDLAVHLFERACLTVDPRGCYNLAMSFLYGEGPLPVDLSLASFFLNSSCSGRFQPACDALFSYGEEFAAARVATHLDPEFLSTFHLDRLQLLIELCDEGSEWACYYKTVVYQTREWAGQRDLYNWFAPLCFDHEIPGACQRAGHLALTMYFDHRDHPDADAYLAAAYVTYENACEAGSPRGCFGWGLFAEDGLFETRSNVRALERYDQACRGYHSGGCEKAEELRARGVRTPADSASQQRRASQSTGCASMTSQGWGVFLFLLLLRIPRRRTG